MRDPSARKRVPTCVRSRVRSGTNRGYWHNCILAGTLQHRIDKAARHSHKLPCALTQIASRLSPKLLDLLADLHLRRPARPPRPTSPRRTCPPSKSPRPSRPSASPPRSSSSSCKPSSPASRLLAKPLLSPTLLLLLFLPHAPALASSTRSSVGIKVGKSCRRSSSWLLDARSPISPHACELEPRNPASRDLTPLFRASL